MRESTIFHMQEANAQRFGVLINQWNFMNNRMIAFERTLFQSTLLERLKFLVFPHTLEKVVDTLTLKLVAEGEEKRKAAAQRPKLTVVSANGH